MSTSTELICIYFQKIKNSVSIFFEFPIKFISGKRIELKFMCAEQRDS